MTPDTLFSIANMVALLSWVLLAVWPRRIWVTGLVAGVGIPALLAVVYVAIVATHWRGAEGGFSTLADVALLFSNPWMLLAGWVHYLCFDLLIGCWEARDARKRNIPQLLLVPCFGLTFMFGPAGWLLYQGVRRAYPARA